MGAEWLNALEDVGGPLVPAARFFTESERPPLPGAGVPGIRWLAEQLEDFVDKDSTGEEDDRFVEGAGALLGLLLIEHLGGRARERDGRHRVQLGRFGWFDPFGAIEDVLDAEDPRRCLSEYVSTAEREASDDGPISSVIRAFVDALQRERPDIAIADQFELSVELDNGASVDLARLERVARDRDPDATSKAARRIVSMLPGADSQELTPWEEAAPRLMPRLVSESFLASLPTDTSLYTAPVGADVYLALQVRYDARSRYVRASEVAAWSLDPNVARKRALTNLANKSASLRIERVSEGVLRVRQGDGLDAARLLLPDLATRLERLADARWVASAPHRDALLFAHGPSIAELRTRAQDALRRAPHPISAALFTLTADGACPLPR